MLPFGLILCWTLLLFATTAPGKAPTIPMLDPFSMLFLGVATFILMLAVAAPQLWWGWRLTSYYSDLRSPTTLILRALGIVMLLSPWWITLLP